MEERKWRRGVRELSWTILAVNGVEAEGGSYGGHGGIFTSKLPST